MHHDLPLWLGHPFNHARVTKDTINRQPLKKDQTWFNMYLNMYQLHLHLQRRNKKTKRPAAIALHHHMHSWQRHRSPHCLSVGENLTTSVTSHHVLVGEYSSPNECSQRTSSSCKFYHHFYPLNNGNLPSNVIGMTGWQFWDYWNQRWNSMIRIRRRTMQAWVEPDPEWVWF